MKKTIGLLAALLFLAPSVQADQVRVIKDNLEAIQIRFDMVTQAARGNHKEILFEYFEVGKDDFTLNLLSYLKKVATEDNVKVKIMVDGMFNDLSKKTMAALMEGTKGNLEIRAFNELSPLTLLSATRRSHDKMFISGDFLVIGSRNAAGPYYGQDLSEGKNFEDLDVVVRGKSVKDARNYFMEMWSGDEVSDAFLGNFSKRKLNETCSNRDKGEQACESQKQLAKNSLAKATRQLQKRMDGLRNLLFLNQDIGWEAQMTEVGMVNFLSNETNHRVDKRHHRISDQIFAALGKANKNLVLITPYLYPSKEVMKFLKTMARRVDVTIITNSRASTDSNLAQAAYESIRDDLIAAGVKLYEYKGPGILHAKTMIIDGKTAIVGSYNLDRRSMYLNREVAVLIKNQGEVMSQIHSYVKKFLKTSWLVGARGKKVDAGMAYRKSNSGKAASITAAAIQLNVFFLHDQI